MDDDDQFIFPISSVCERVSYSWSASTNYIETHRRLLQWNEIPLVELFFGFFFHQVLVLFGARPTRIVDDDHND